VVEEVAATSLGCPHTLDSCVGVDVKLARGENIVDILASLLNIALDIHGETRCFRDGETEVESDDTRKTTKTDEKAPTVVHMLELIEIVVDNLIFEGGHQDG